MFVGTGSDVGKSVIAAAFCRIFREDGFHPAPFKSQNMSLNSFVTANGGEIGRAQAVQAEACGIDCLTDMNPVLLKPSSDKTAQVILNGKVFGNYSAGSYFRGEIKEQLFSEAMNAFYRLAEKYNPMVLEGAGSISELNLKENDIANMRVAIATNAATILVADIERGGVFASVYGSIQLLSPDERKQIKGIIINKFRGDIRLFDEGRKIMEEITGVPVLGVIPAFIFKLKKRIPCRSNGKLLSPTTIKLMLRLFCCAGFPISPISTGSNRMSVCIYITQTIAQSFKKQILLFCQDQKIPLPTSLNCAATEWLPKCRNWHVPEKPLSEFVADTR